ncbi:MAG: flagellum-specific ATP synthase FliI, partial [Lachnospiraceae bacterium]|nr:flagellum-specific ATP synthase FliI [Lachnospiraceae bacterium]
MGFDLNAVQLDKYDEVLTNSFFAKKGKVVNVIGLTIESAGPEAKIGDLCLIHPIDEDKDAIRAEVVGFKDGMTQLMPYEATD